MTKEHDPTKLDNKAPYESPCKCTHSNARECSCGGSCRCHLGEATVTMSPKPQYKRQTKEEYFKELVFELGSNLDYPPRLRCTHAENDKLLSIPFDTARWFVVWRLRRAIKKLAEVHYLMYGEKDWLNVWGDK